MFIWEGAALWDPGGGTTGKRLLNSKMPVEANKNNTRTTQLGIDAHSRRRGTWPVRRWHYQQQKQPRTCTHAPLSHSTVEEPGPFSSYMLSWELRRHGTRESRTIHRPAQTVLL